jgi:N6-adenosine-specific RNA methylase IME4
MERQLTSAKTYDQIKRVIKEATALKVLLGHVNEVKTKAEDTILAAHRRIGMELKKIPKATGKNLPAREDSKEATGIPATNRHRFGKLADTSEETIKETAAKLRKEGKDATPRAVLTEIIHGDKAQRRETKQQKLAAKIKALPGNKKFGVVYADPGWRTKTWSEKGLDKSADLHYTTTELDEIKNLGVAAITADDCVLFLWSTSPHFKQAIEVLEAWGFEFKTFLTWDKEVPGHGHWLFNQTEHLIIATKGNFVGPGDSQKIPSLYRERKTEHSAKPDFIAEWIEKLYPDIPKIELFARKARPGWDSWGNEASDDDIFGLDDQAKET